MTYVLIGGLAAGFHGYPGTTQDLDICYARDPENLERLASALIELHAKLRGVDAEVPFILDAKTLRLGDSFTFVTDLGDVDCLGTPSGTRGFDDLVQGASEFTAEGLSVLVCSLEDLERMKRAASRPKDLVALEWIKAIREETDPGRN